MNIEHQYDCKGGHRIAVDNAVGAPTMYEHTAFFVTPEGRVFMAVTPYYEGTLPHHLCEGVYELTKVGEDAKMAVAYNLHIPEEPCPWFGKPDQEKICPLSKCPQKKGS